MMQSAEERYRDIIGMEYHRSSKHPHMSMRDRAAQFSPFAALTGYDEEIDEAARLTSDRLELDEAQMELISSELTRAAKALEKNRREGRNGGNCRKLKRKKICITSTGEDAKRIMFS